MRVTLTKPTRVANFWGATQVVSINRELVALYRGDAILVVPADQDGTVLQYNSHVVGIKYEDFGDEEWLLQPGVYRIGACCAGAGGGEVAGKAVSWQRLC